MAKAYCFRHFVIFYGYFHHNSLCFFTFFASVELFLHFIGKITDFIKHFRPQALFSTIFKGFFHFFAPLDYRVVSVIKLPFLFL